MLTRRLLSRIGHFVLSGRRRCLSSTQQVNPLPVNRRKLLYRSKQTGFLELDLILGNWAEDNLSKLSEREVREYEKLIRSEVPDLYSWLSGQQKPPEEVDGSIFRRIREAVRNGTINKSKVADKR